MQAHAAHLRDARCQRHRDMGSLMVVLIDPPYSTERASTTCLGAGTSQFLSFLERLILCMHAHFGDGRRAGAVRVGPGACGRLVFHLLPTVPCAPGRTRPRAGLSCAPSIR